MHQIGEGAPVTANNMDFREIYNIILRVQIYQREIAIALTFELPFGSIMFLDRPILIV